MVEASAEEKENAAADARGAEPAEDSLSGTVLADVCRRAPGYCQPMYRLLRDIIKGWYKLEYGLKIVGQENIPASGACIAASNHMSLLDPPLVAIAVNTRQVHFVAKKELFQTPVLGAILARCGCMWVDRSSKDGKAVNQAIDMLSRGRLVGIFPEGTRSKDGKLGRCKLGVAFMSLKAGAPILPMCLFNTLEAGKRNGLPYRAGLHVRIGKLIPVEKKDEPGPSDMKRVCNLVIEKIRELQELGPIQD
ncbi:1-acyl-sn-glycerol-3-phosphate acyltransferase [bacterium]|nr:1-acyl-sn-glycerol-3-phosphate acyltransferase [bacterium]